jgi:hypothetical protein
MSSNYCIYAGFLLAASAYLMTYICVTARRRHKDLKRSRAAAAIAAAADDDDDDIEKSSSCEATDTTVSTSTKRLSIVHDDTVHEGHSALTLWQSMFGVQSPKQQQQQQQTSNAAKDLHSVAPIV